MSNKYDTAANREIIAAYWNTSSDSNEVFALLTAQCLTEKKIELLTKIGVEIATFAQLTALAKESTVAALVNRKWEVANRTQLYWAYFS